MKIKPDWLPILHEIRRREIEIVFKNVAPGSFQRGLEIGAGDGFQSKLLKPYVQHLVCTEYDSAKLLQTDQPGITYKICDAENLLDEFEPESFDLVFSSSVLEHIERKEKVLQDLSRLLTPGGLAINIMPGPFLKLSWLAFFYPNQAITLIEQLTERGGAGVAKLAAGDKQEIQKLRTDLGNNPKSRQASWLISQIWPQPHGAFRGHIREFLGYQPKRWTQLHERAGLEVIAKVKMPVVSGYGFGLHRLRRILEKLGFTYGYAYIARRSDATTPPPATF